MQTLKALAVLLAVFLPCSVFASQSDNFDDNSKDPSLWGNDVLEGGARLDEVNGRLEYSVSQPGPDHDQAGRPWIRRLPMGQNWVATVAVGNTSSPADRHDSTAGFKIFHPSNPGEVLFVELYAFRDGGRVHRGVLTSLDGPNNVFGEADAQGLGVETALLRISYNSQSKVVTTSYKIGADGWVDLGVFGLGGSGGSTANRDWSLSPTGNFGLMLGGFSGASVVSPGQIWLDDFSLEVPTTNVHGRILTVSATATSELTSHNRLAAHLLDASWNAEETSASLGLVWESAGIGFHPGGPHDRAPMVMFDLGKSHSLSKIRIWNFPEPPVAVKRLALEISNDGVDYTQVEIVDNMEIAGETLVPVSIPFARHVRFRILNNHGGTAYPVLEEDPVTGFFAFAGLVEVAFYGAEAEAKAPEITRGPEPRTIEAGATATFSVEATGIPTPTYQWRRNGEDLEDGALYVGTRGPTLAVRGAQPGHSGLFDVVVSNLAGSTPSAKVLLTVNPAQEPPQITAHPSAARVVEGSTVQFSAAASGVPAPELQWQVSSDGGATWTNLDEGRGVTGVNSEKLAIANVPLELNGRQFRLRAVNGAGVAESNGAPLEVTSDTSEITGHLVWYRADSAQFAGLEDGQPIANWLPEAGSSANPIATQVAGSEIVYRKNVPGLNGRPALEFPGGRSVVRSIANIDFDGVTMFLVFKNIGSGGAQRAVASENSNTLLGPWHPSVGGSYVPVIHFDGAWVAQPQEISGWVDPLGCVLGVALDANSTEKTFINGTPIAHPGGPRPLPTARVGMLAFNGAVGPHIEPYHGHIAEFVVFKRVLSDSEIAKIHEYLLEKYGLGDADIPPSIEANPPDQTVVAGTRAAFVAEVGGFPPPALQWQSSTDGGASWSDLEPGGGFDGVNTKLLTIPSATLAMNGRQFRLRAVSGAGVAESRAATLVVNPPVVEPVRVAGVLATATSELTSLNRLAAHAVNGVYCDHSFFETAGVGFTPGGPDDRDPAITFDLRSPVALSHFTIWNSHEHDPAIKRMVVEISLDGLEFTSFGEKMLQPGGGCPPTPQTVDMGGVVARFVRFDFLENWNGVIFPVVGTPTGWPFIAIDEVEFYGAGAESSAPKITREPLPQTIDVGGDAVFSVEATGVPAPSYQWRRNGVDLEEGERHVGVKSSQFTLRMARVEDGGEFDVVVFNVAGSIPSAKVPLVVRPPAVPPAITLHPQSKTVVEGGGVKFSAGASGTPAPSLKWQRSTDGGQTWSDLVSAEWVQGVDSAELTIVAAKQEFSNHRFRLHALNSAGSAFSDPATLTVQPVVAQPVLIAGVLATATSELTSHNRLAAHAVNGVYCDHSFFETAGVSFTPGGPDDRDPAITFDLRSPVALSHFTIWNSHEHDPAIKRMVVEISMDGQQFTSIGEKMLQPGGGCPPTPQTVDMGGVVARFVRFDFLENWNGVIFPVVGTPTGWPFIAIDEVEFYGRLGLAIHPQPLDLRVFEGSEAVLTVGLSSGADAQYQWWRDGERLADGAGVSGAASATLRLRGVAPADAGRFQAVATLDSISLTSRVATLTVRMAPPMNQRTNFSVLHVFDDSFFKESNKPGKVGSGLIEGSDGFLYGTTRHGGTNLVDVAGPARGVGTLYRIRKDGTEFTILHHFGGDNSSSYSSIWTEPIEASDGLLYGVTYAGGVAGVGYIYKIHRDGSGFAILHHFQDGSVSGDAARSTAPLVEGPDGMLYGVTQYGGVKPSWTDWGQGTAFRIAKDGSNYQVLHSFGATPQSPTQPTGLSLGRDGRLYGTTARGGDLGAGTLFRMNLDGGDLVVLAELGNWSSRPDFLPGNPLHASDGLLYGISQSSGHIYKLQPSDGEFSLLTPILSNGSGGEPRPALIETRGGYLATPVISHGAHNAGSVVALSKDGSEVATLHSFNPSVEPGGYPSSRLLEASDGALYGVTGMVDKTPENGGHAMIYRLAWNDNPNIWVFSPTRRPGGGWRIPFTTEETGLHTLWHAANPSGPWVAAQSLFLKAAEGEFTHEEGSENAIFFRISKE